MSGIRFGCANELPQVVKFTHEGGLAVKLTNKTGSAYVKGPLVSANDGQNSSVKLVQIDVPDCFGVFYDSGVADGSDGRYWGSCRASYIRSFPRPSI